LGFRSDSPWGRRSEGFRGGFGGFKLACAKGLAVGAIAADFSSGEHDLKAEVGFDLTAEPLQGVAEELFHFSATEADDVGVFLFAARFVKMLLTRLVHEIELVHESTFLEELEGAVDGDAVELRVFFPGELEEAFGVEVLAGFVDEIEEDLALTGLAHAAAGERVF
jgi:hypothetical protein